MNKVATILMCVGIAVLFVMPLSSIESTVLGIHTDVARVNMEALDGGWLEERDGVKILHLNGSYYDMGYQHGYLLSDEIRIQKRMMLDFFEDMGFPYDVLVERWNEMKGYVPEPYMQEMQGMADGSGISPEEIFVLNTLHDTANFLSCCGAIMWGSATADGKLIHLRSGDLTIFMQDAETGTYWQELQAVIVHNPDNAYASVSPMWIGCVGSYGGFNEKGIAVGETTCWTDDTTLHGTCAGFRMGLVLDQAASGTEAITILETNRTCGWDLLVSDANIPEGYVLEQTANVSHVCTWDDASESTDPFWMIEDVLRRANCFVHPDMAALQREHYDISNMRSILRLVTGQDSYYGIWRHYVALSKGIESIWGAMNVNTTMAMCQEFYQGKNDL
ncbi:MAG: C45 family autoproteolytic acyltransferase/hydrolase, partial [Thermoplasmatota archaeon]